jgi:ribosomal protein L11
MKNSKLEVDNQQFSIKIDSMKNLLKKAEKIESSSSLETKTRKIKKLTFDFQTTNFSKIMKEENDNKKLEKNLYKGKNEEIFSNMIAIIDNIRRIISELENNDVS